MPKYVIGCIEGHDFTVTVPYSKFHVLKMNLKDAPCKTLLDEYEGAQWPCGLCLFIKPSPIPFEMKIRGWSKD